MTAGTCGGQACLIIAADTNLDIHIDCKCQIPYAHYRVKGAVRSSFLFNPVLLISYQLQLWLNQLNPHVSSMHLGGERETPVGNKSIRSKQCPHTPVQQVALFVYFKRAGLHQSQEMQDVGVACSDRSAYVSSMLSNQTPLKRDTAKIRLRDALMQRG